jgi:TetR/AcrR family transcriptional regulator
MRKPMSAAQDRSEDAPKAPRMRKAERRRQLIGFAAIRFANLGYEATTTSQIAAAAGVSEALLARYFESKKAILLAILAEIRSVSLDRWQSELAALSDPLAKLHKLTELYLKTTGAYALAFQIMHRLLLDGADDEIMSAVRSFYLDVETLLATVIADGQQSGVIRRSLDSRIGAWQLMQTAVGFTMTRALAVPLFDEPDYLARAVDCLLECLIKTDV